MSDPELRRRSTDKSFWGRFRGRQGWRDVIALLAVLCAGGAGVVAYQQGQAIQEGRRAGSRLTCSVGAALTNGGQRFVAASASGDVSPKLAAFLARYGYPSKSKRHEQAQQAAVAYATFIGQSIVAQVGPKAEGIVRADGSFDCRKFAALAKIPR